MGAIFSFLSGGVFRAVWGEVSSFFQKKQDAKIEIEKMRLQGELDEKQSNRALEAIKVQAALGVKTIQVQADADVSRAEADAYREAVANIFKPTGIAWVDAWNGIVRPSYATVALLLWGWYEMQHMYLNAWVISAWSMDLVGTIAGFYFASRELGKRGK